MRPTTLDAIARRFPKLTIIGAHLGNPDYAWAAEVTRWNPNLYFDLSGSSLIKKQDDPTFWKSIFWWSGIVSPHTPANAPNAFERLVFGSDVFNGELEEFDRRTRTLPQNARCLRRPQGLAGYDLCRHDVENSERAEIAGVDTREATTPPHRRTLSHRSLDWQS